MPALVKMGREGQRGGSPQPPAKKKVREDQVCAMGELSLIMGGKKAPPVPRETLGIRQPVCMVCGVKCAGYYGRWGDSGTCTLACEAVQKASKGY